MQTLALGTLSIPPPVKPTALRTAIDNSKLPRIPEPVNIVYVPGMLTPDEAQVKCTQELSALFGAEVYAAFNRTGPTPVNDVWNAALGLADDGKGIALEREACANLERAIRKALIEKRPIHIIAFSQGSIITHNVLEHLSRKMNNWQELQKGIKVTVLGAYLPEWPGGLNVTMYLFSKDPIPKLMKFAGTLFRFRKKDLSLKVSEVVTVSGGAHMFSKYLEVFSPQLLERVRS